MKIKNAHVDLYQSGVRIEQSGRSGRKILQSAADRDDQVGSAHDLIRRLRAGDPHATQGEGMVKLDGAFARLSLAERNPVPRREGGERRLGARVFDAPA